MESKLQKLFDYIEQHSDLKLYRMYCPDSNVYPRIIVFGDISEIEGDHNSYGSGLFRITFEIYCKSNYTAVKKQLLEILNELKYDIESETDIQGDDIYHMQVVARKYIIYE